MQLSNPPLEKEPDRVGGISQDDREKVKSEREVIQGREAGGCRIGM